MGLVFNQTYKTVPSTSVNVSHLPDTHQLTATNISYLRSIGLRVKNGGKAIIIRGSVRR